VFSRLEQSKVHIEARLIDAMRALDNGAAEIALVIDENDRLVGTMTDGDIRRALLTGAALESPVRSFVQRNFTAVRPMTGRAEVLDLMQARTISQIPVVDPDGKLIGLHLLREVIGCAERPNWAVVMAGGKGTRLRPITENLPKPMIRVAGRPILERLVLHLVGFGVRRIFLSINYMGHMVEDHFQDGSAFGCRIEYLKEESPLGTAGALSLLRDLPSDPVLVINGDLVTQAHIGNLLDFHAQGGYKATVGVRDYYHTVPYGCIDTEGNRITCLEEKPMVSKTVNAGIYVLDPSIISLVPKDCEVQMPALLEQQLSLGACIGAFRVEGDWMDIGQHDQLRSAREGTA
jgi:dTDP-glucose pyrophosphorylase